MSLKTEHLAKQAYYLTYESKPVPTIVFHIHPAIIQKGYPVGGHAEKKLQEKIPNFPIETSLNKNWGFGGLSQNRGVTDGHTAIAFPMYPPYHYTDSPCESCGGTGKEEFVDYRCRECYGEKKQKVLDPEKKVMYYSIELMIRLLSFMQMDMELQQDLQLMCAIDGYTDESYARNLVGFYAKNKTGPNFVKPGIGSSYIHCPEAHAAMMEIYGFLYQERTLHGYDFEAYVTEDRGFFVRCPGVNGCYVGVERFHRIEGRHEFTNHNIDNITQELTLLTGLAAIHQTVLQDVLS